MYRQRLSPIEAAHNYNRHIVRFEGEWPQVASTTEELH